MRKTYKGIPTIEGAGVKLTRIFSQPDTADVDPFLLLDFFDSYDPADFAKGFPWHPHRGIETITYLIEGRITHGDNLGNSGVIGPLGCQWMTAGRSIIHQEMPDTTGRILGTQLWLNLPRAHKMTAPAYRDISAEDVPSVENGDVQVRVVAGAFLGVHGPVRGTYVDPIFFDITIHPGGIFQANIPVEENVFLFLLNGRVFFPDGMSASAPDIRGILLGSGERVKLSSEDGARLLLIAGRPLREPVAWGGPIVMNTQDELREAFRQMQDGTFVQK